MIEVFSKNLEEITRNAMIDYHSTLLPRSIITSVERAYCGIYSNLYNDKYFLYLLENFKDVEIKRSLIHTLAETKEWDKYFIYNVENFRFEEFYMFLLNVLNERKTLLKANINFMLSGKEYNQNFRYAIKSIAHLFRKLFAHGVNLGKCRIQKSVKQMCKDIDELHNHLLDYNEEWKYEDIIVTYKEELNRIPFYRDIDSRTYNLFYTYIHKAIGFMDIIFIKYLFIALREISTKNV